MPPAPPAPAPPAQPGVVSLLTHKVGPTKGKLPLKLRCEPTGAVCRGSLKIVSAQSGLTIVPG